MPCLKSGGIPQVNLRSLLARRDKGNRLTEGACRLILSQPRVEDSWSLISSDPLMKNVLPLSFLFLNCPAEGLAQFFMGKDLLMGPRSVFSMPHPPGAHEASCYQRTRRLGSGGRRTSPRQQQQAKRYRTAKHRACGWLRSPFAP